MDLAWQRRCLPVLVWSVFFLLVGPLPKTIANARDDNAVGPAPAFQTDGKISNETSTTGARVASLSAAELTTLCFAPNNVGDGGDGGDEDEPPPLFTNTTTPLELERVEDASENLDIETLARFSLREAFLDPSKPANSTLVVPLAEDIMACGPDLDMAMASLEVLSACQTKPSDDPDEDIVFLIQWSATFVCANSVLVLRGSELDVSVGSVLVVSSTEPSVSIEKLFVTSL